MAPGGSTARPRRRVPAGAVTLAVLLGAGLAAGPARAVPPAPRPTPSLAALKRLERDMVLSSEADDEGDRSGRPRDRDEAGGPQGVPVWALPRPIRGATIAGAPVNHLLNDRASDHTLFSCQSEVTIAAAGQRVLAAWNDGEAVSVGGDVLGYAWSADGGATWTAGGPPPRGTTVALWTSDPVIAVDEKTGTFYLAALATTTDARNSVAVVTGTFPDSGGFVFGPPTIARSVRDTLPDKPWIVADSLTGNLYLAYTTFLRVGDEPTDEIEIQSSRDGNGTWDPPMVLSPPADAGLVQGARTAVGPAGELYVAWKTVDTSQASGGRDWIRIRASRDGGASYAPVRNVTDLFTNFGSGAPGYNRPNGFAFPGLAVDRTAGPYRGRVYACWNESVDFYGDALGTTGDQSEVEPNGNASAATTFIPGVTLRGSIADGNDVDWYRFGGARGQTVVAFLDSLADTLDVAMRLFCGDGQTRLAYCAPPGARPRLFVFTLPADGEYLLRVSPNSLLGGGYRVRTAFHAAAGERARDHRDVFVSHSDDGVRWTTPVRANDDPPWLDDWLPEVAVGANGTVVLVWYDWRDASEVFCNALSLTYLATSADGGVSWGANAAIADTPSPWSQVSSNLAPNQGDYLGLFANRESAFVAWADGRNGDPDAYAAVHPLALDPAPPPLDPALRLDRAWPNPTRGSLLVRFEVPRAGRATLTLHDLAGREWRRAEVSAAGPGWQVVDLEPGPKLPSGLYFIHLVQGGDAVNRKVVLAR
jgi:hypothetical protein